MLSGFELYPRWVPLNAELSGHEKGTMYRAKESRLLEPSVCRKLFPITQTKA